MMTREMMTTQTIKLEVLGEPVAKGRPLISVRGGFARAYTPKKTRQAEADIRAQILRQLPQGFKPLEGALDVELVFRKDRPKSLPKRYAYAVKHPDIDNYIKTCLDAMESIVFKNDAQIVSLAAIKVYAEPSGTMIEIREMEG
jgi:Holliday junction resolvase RusA-like endonuclease